MRYVYAKEMKQKYCMWDIHDSVWNPSFYPALSYETLGPHAVLVQKYRWGVRPIYSLLAPTCCAWNSFRTNATFQHLW